jgi:hypothetical protein
MPVQIGGDPQAPQDQNHLSNLQQNVEQFVRDSRQVTDSVQDLLRFIEATSYLSEIGDAPADAFLTASSNARTVQKVREQIKAVCSFAVLTGDLTESEANGIIQTAYGNDTETVVPSDQIKGLTNQWV